MKVQGSAIKRTLKRIVIYGIASYVAICALLFAIQDRLVYFPTTSNTPLRVVVEEYELSPSDPIDVSLHGYIVNSDTEGPVVVFFTGNAGDARSYVNVLAQLESTVVLTNYRGYGKSSGKPSEKTILSDAKAIIEWTKSHYPQRPIFLMGFSLGSGVALLSSDGSVDGLILVSPFRSLVHVANRTVMRIFPLRLLMRNRFDSQPMLDSLPESVLVLYSTVDTLIPTKETVSLLKHVPQATVLTDDVHHNRLLSRSENVQAIRDWLKLQNWDVSNSDD